MTATGDAGIQMLADAEANALCVVFWCWVAFGVYVLLVQRRR